MITRRLFATLFTLSLLISPLMPVMVRGQGSQQADDKKDKKKDDKPKLTREEKEYQKIKRFSQEMMVKDSDFREGVEEAYSTEKRKQTEYAYFVNTRDASDEQITRTGDKLKVDDTLYDNPLAQDYVNRVGQSIVPAGSKNLYVFRITLNPIPEARSLSTGTVYISSGYLSLIDNEAQLAYMLGHEIAHVEKEHWKDDVLVAQGVDLYNEKQAKKRAMWGAIIGMAAGAASQSAGQNNGMLNMMMAASLAPSIMKLVYRDAVTSWDRLQEDEADLLSLNYMLKRNYDIREVPKLYATVRRTSNRDPRARLGFIAERDRLEERDELIKVLIGSVANQLPRNLMVGATNLAESRNRTPDRTADSEEKGDSRPGKALDLSRNSEERSAKAETAIKGSLSAELMAKLDSGELIGTTGEFEAVMAGLKRDNGVRAFYYDMFQMARENLEESLRIRSNDPYSHYYYGKVLKLTARSASEKSRALNEFVTAIQLDRRRVIAEPHLYRALSMIESKDPAQVKEITESLKQYVAIYQREHVGKLPPNMDVIYDYMQEAGELGWMAAPAMNVRSATTGP
ncbi:MAG TPA: M48 family metalloprotease [Pyrinomonadaceae bacterium]|nr:M48 family metalloprotease [Pyrinomonadaceae bacterium]